MKMLLKVFAIILALQLSINVSTETEETNSASDFTSGFLKGIDIKSNIKDFDNCKEAWTQLF